MQEVGYINEMGENIKIEFALKKNRIVPKSEKDRENLISAWGIDDEILEAFLEFINAKLKNNEARIALLTNTKEYQFFDSEEIYNAVAFKLGEKATRGEIESLIDRIYDSAIFSDEELVFCAKVNLQK